MYTKAIRCIVGLAILFCAARSAQTREIEELSIDELPPGQQIEIQTTARFYRIEMIDRSTGAVQAEVSTDGRKYADAHRIYLLGATRRPQQGDGGITLVIMHRIKVGMSMELGIRSLQEADRWISSPVKRITVLPAGIAGAVR